MTFLCIEDGFLHRWACMWNLYIVKKWIIDVHGATKGHLSPGDEPLQNPPSSMMFPWINAHLQHARWFASHVWWQSGYIGYISWSPKFQFFILFSSWLFKSPWTSPWLIVKSHEIPTEIPIFHGENSHGKFSGNPNASPRPSASLGPGVARYRAWIPDPRWDENADDWGMVNMALFYPR